MKHEKVIKKIKEDIRNFTINKGTLDELIKAIHYQQKNQDKAFEWIHRNNSELFNKFIVILTFVLGVSGIINFIEFFFSSLHKLYQLMIFLSLVVILGLIFYKFYRKTTYINEGHLEDYREAKEIEKELLKLFEND